MIIFLWETRERSRTRKEKILQACLGRARACRGFNLQVSAANHRCGLSVASQGLICFVVGNSVNTSAADCHDRTASKSAWLRACTVFVFVSVAVSRNKRRRWNVRVLGRGSLSLSTRPMSFWPRRKTCSLLTGSRARRLHATCRRLPSWGRRASGSGSTPFAAPSSGLKAGRR